jgi:PhnB protein
MEARRPKLPRIPVGSSLAPIGDSVVMVEDEDPQRGTKAPPKDGLDGTPAYLYIYVEDVDATVQNAEKHGATVVRMAGLFG